MSGLPLRALSPLFLQYGVDAVFTGHDEMYERSAVPGQERLADGTMRDHVLQVYDVGVAGIHRLFHQRPKFDAANAVEVVQSLVGDGRC